jgi:hypothetical protein
MSKLDRTLEMTHHALMALSEPLFMVLRGVHWVVTKCLDYRRANR